MKVEKRTFGLGVTVGIFVIALFLVALLFLRSAKSIDQNGAETLETALVNASVLCYSLEGFYPPTVTYLTENYGIIIDTKRYVVDYEIFASNIRPEIRVVHK